MDVRKGDRARVAFRYAGVVSYEDWTVMRRRGLMFWLDNGAGNPPHGPFNSLTGVHAEFSEQRVVAVWREK